MTKVVLQSVLIMLGLTFIGSVYGHPATERYIPIGYWVSVADGYTYMGEIKSHDAAVQSMTVEGSSGYKTVAITKQTKVWLDRSELKLTNLKGSYSDCREGRTVEVKFKDDSDTEAEWVKVRITTR